MIVYILYHSFDVYLIFLTRPSVLLLSTHVDYFVLVNYYELRNNAGRA